MPAQATKRVRLPEPPEPAEKQLDRDEIAALAYALWQLRGCPDGSPDEDWFRAEAELRQRSETAA